MVLLGKSILMTQTSEKQCSRATGLCINGASWTGIPGYCRFTLALKDADFDRVLECIVKIKELVK
ncbi:Aminotransferase, class I/classII [Artemisia annua]|uniref:Aminotransferase, class I/classII n=1 Tax=Artemisia annua TaxID=35608 RepID=A0A2U1KUM2_ARTAN|nr:Aminotransferase, class I/classII [Artemisia annua]